MNALADWSLAIAAVALWLTAFLASIPAPKQPIVINASCELRGMI